MLWRCQPTDSSLIVADVDDSANQQAPRAPDDQGRQISIVDVPGPESSNLAIGSIALTSAIVIPS